MSQPTNQEIDTIIRRLIAYAEHGSDCEIDQTDFCTCGLYRLCGEAQALREQIVWFEHESNISPEILKAVDSLSKTQARYREGASQ